MATTKPTKPSITLPPAFGTSPSNVKTPYTAQELVDGYSASIQQILDGGNVNWLNDTFFKFLTYTTAICDWLNNAPVKKIPFINSSNQLDYIDAPAGNIIGTILAINCTASYVPDGCLPCDGSEYTKAQFSDLWTNFLTSNPAKLNVCTYEQYQSDISTYGQCGKFAVDTTNNKFKVPTIKDGSYLTQAKSDTELGKAYNESLPNHAHTFSSSHGLFLGNAAGGWANNLDGTGRLNTTAGAASSSVYQDGAKVQGDNIRVRFFVVVSNGQINQSQMDWSQWASSLSGKANVDLSNISNIAQSFINTVLTWGIPDYSAGIDVATTLRTTKNYTAPTKGILFNGMLPGQDCKIKINGNEIGTRRYSTYGNWIPTGYYLDAGDTFTFDGGAPGDNAGGAYFFPLKGVN